jgi:uncharacterized cupin superfamily protein
MSMLAQMLCRVSQQATTPDVNRPDPAVVIAGDPVHSTWNIESLANLYCGVWQSTPGAWRVSYDEWEYIYIHSGHSVLTDQAGNAVHLRAGDRYIIRPGFKGVWEVVETTVKDYVIHT